MEYIGAFAPSTKWVPHDFSTLSVLFLVYFGREAESLYSCSPFWYNGCRGSRENYFGIRDNRETNNLLAIMNLLTSLVEWDRDPKLRDEFASLAHLCAREQHGVHNDQ